jgi:hypothetical protein
MKKIKSKKRTLFLAAVLVLSVPLAIGAALIEPLVPAWEYINGVLTSRGPVSIGSSLHENIKAHGTVSSGTEVFDLNDGTYHTVTAGGNFTVDFSNFPASAVGSVTMKITNGGAHTVTWDSAIDWPAGSAPALTAAGTDFLIFFSDDGGTTIYGNFSMVDVK